MTTTANGFSQTACKPDPAFGKNKVNCDFTKGACSALSELPGTTLKYDGKGAVFSISKDSEAPTVATGKFIFFGRLDVEVQAAAGKGIVTSVVLQSKDLDEVCAATRTGVHLVCFHFLVEFQTNMVSLDRLGVGWR